jgi:hypothetical protein
MSTASTVETVAKGANTFVKVTHEDRVDWISFTTLLAAQEAAAAIELGFADAQTIKLDPFFDRFMEHHAIPNLRPRTVSRYSAVYDGQIRSILGEKTLAISPKDVEAFRVKLKAQGENNHHIDSATDVLSAILGIGVKWTYIKSNPVNNLDS